MTTGRYRGRLIRRFMVLFGPISSIFDFATFGVMLFVFDARGGLFQTAWFLESLGTQSLIIFAIRTRRVPFFSSRPSTALVAGTLGALAVGYALPFTPIGSLFGFVTPPLPLLAVIAAMLVVYMTLVEVVKAFFFGRVPSLPHRPISDWRLAPALRNVERFASRWSSGRRSRPATRSAPRAS